MFKKINKPLILTILILSAVPLFTSNEYYIDLAIRMIINSIIVMGLNLLIGYAGQISLGHAGFVGLGAFASAVLPTHFNINPIASMILGAIVVSFIALIISQSILKLKGHFLAMATLGMGIIINIILRNESQYTGGPDGMGVPIVEVFNWSLTDQMTWYWIVAVLLIFSIWASLNLIKSPFGRALRAIHGSDVASQVAGVDVTKYKVAIFVLSAFFASIMGSIYAFYIGFITPSISEFTHSVELLTMAVVGGVASIYGSIIGAVLLTALPQLLAGFEGWETLVYGVILVVCMIFVPKGIVPTLAQRFMGRDKS